MESKKRHQSSLTGKKNNVPTGSRGNEKHAGKQVSKSTASKGADNPSLPEGSGYRFPLVDRTSMPRSDTGYAQSRPAQWVADSARASDFAQTGGHGQSDPNYGNCIPLTNMDHVSGALSVDVSQVSIPSSSHELNLLPVDSQGMSMTNAGDNFSGMNFGPEFSRGHEYGIPPDFQGAQFSNDFSHPMTRYSTMSQDSFSTFDSAHLHPPMVLSSNSSGHIYPTDWNPQLTHESSAIDAMPNSHLSVLPPSGVVPEMFPAFPQTGFEQQPSGSVPAVTDSGAWPTGEGGATSGVQGMFPSLSPEEIFQITSFMDHQRFAYCIK